MEFDYFVVIDFEATCERDSRIYPQEIIEFPAVLVDAATGGLVSSFRTYVRPRHHPRLTEFCSELTGIRQDQVDGGVDLEQALAMHDAWLKEAGAAKNSLAVVTWGDWDCRTMLEFECSFKGLTKPSYFNQWVNLRIPFEASRQSSVLGGATFRRQSRRQVCSGTDASTAGSMMPATQRASSQS